MPVGLLGSIDKKGFAFVGLVLCFLLMSVFAAGGMVFIRSLGGQEYKSISAEVVDQVRRSLFVYAKLHGGSLPYADVDGDGWEDPGDEVSGHNYKGGLPYNTLRIFPGDNWRRNLIYEVNPSLVTDKIPAGFENMTPSVSAPYLLEIKNDICAALTAGIVGTPEVWDGDAAVASPFVVAAVIASAGPGDADLDDDLFDAVAGQGSNVTGLPYVRASEGASFDDIVSYLRVQPFEDNTSLYGWLAAHDTYDWAACQ